MKHNNNHIDKKITPAISYHGGKSLLSRKIINLFPEHHTYVEPFAGGLSVLLNKYRSPVEIVSDLYPGLIDLYTCIRDRVDDLIVRAHTIPYARESFQHAKNSKTTDPFERAMNTLVLQRMGRSGLGKDFSTNCKDEKFSHEHGWLKIENYLYQVSQRLQGVQFYNKPALDVLREFDSPNSLFYLDPPYYPATRVSPKIYYKEMTRMEHLLFLKSLHGFQAQMVVSGYRCGLYDKELAGWERYEFDVASFAGQVVGKQRDRRIEVLWVKPTVWPF